MGFNTRTINTIAFRSGTTITNGSEVEVVPLNTTHCGIKFKPLNGGPEVKIKIRYEIAHQYLAGFNKAPSVKSLEKKFSEMSTCKTPIGNTVEVDGQDQYGFPSWCSILLGV